MGIEMNEKQMMAAIYEHAFLYVNRENSDYEFTEAEQQRFYRAIEKCYAKLEKLSATHFDEEIYEKIYGF